MQHLDDLGLAYVVGITSALVVWPPGVVDGGQEPRKSVDMQLT